MRVKLLPDRSAAENVAYALKVQGEGSSSIRRKVPEVLNLVGLAHKMSSLPDELSGGEQQRVSIARAVVNHPPLLICDVSGSCSCCTGSTAQVPRS